LVVAEGGVEFEDEGCAEGVEGFGTVELDWRLLVELSSRCMIAILRKRDWMYVYCFDYLLRYEILTESNTRLWRRYKNMLIRLPRRIPSNKLEAGTHFSRCPE
jgi:hypothetical protein